MVYGGSQLLTYKTLAVLVSLGHTVFLTQVEIAKIISYLALSAWLIPPLVQPSERVSIPVLTASPETNFSSCLMLAMQPNVRTPARQGKAERGGCPVQHHQIKISAVAKYFSPNREQNNIHRIFGENLICSYMW